MQALELRLAVAQRLRKLPQVITLGALERLLGGKTIETDTFAHWINFNAYIALQEGMHRGYTIYTLSPMEYHVAYNILEN